LGIILSDLALLQREAPELNRRRRPKLRMRNRSSRVDEATFPSSGYDGDVAPGADGHANVDRTHPPAFGLEQNPAERSKFAREGHDVAWEFAPGGGYGGRRLIDGETLTGPKLRTSSCDSD
jgi:hypothetical protein